MPGRSSALCGFVMLVSYTTLASRFGLARVLSATAAIQLNSSVIARIRALLTGEATLSTPREPCDKPTLTTSLVNWTNLWVARSSESRAHVCAPQQKVCAHTKAPNSLAALGSATSAPTVSGTTAASVGTGPIDVLAADAEKTPLLGNF